MTAVISASELGAHLRPGDYIVWGQGPAEPLLLTEQLRECDNLPANLSVFIGFSWGELPDPTRIMLESYCGTAENRKLAASGQLSIVPCHYSALPAYLSARASVLFLQLAPGRRPGHYSWSMACEYLASLLGRARLVVAEINMGAPSSDGPQIAADAIDLIVESNRPPLPLPVGGERHDAIVAAIAANVASLIDDGACLQLGLGGIPDAVLSQLGQHRDIGIHSGLIGESVAGLVEAGVVTGARKLVDRGKVVAGLLAGGSGICSLAGMADTPIMLAPTTYTHALPVMAAQPGFTAVNSAIEIDLLGQVNAEIAGGRYVGAVGGATDFLRGAAASHNGKPVIALPTTAKGRDGMPVSRIVTSLSGPTTISRADIGIVVTEFGAVDLRGKNDDQRRAALIALAHPQFQDDLLAGSHERRPT